MDESAAVMVAVAETRTEEMERSRELARSTAQHAVKARCIQSLKTPVQITQRENTDLHAYQPLYQLPRALVDLAQ